MKIKLFRSFDSLFILILQFLGVLLNEQSCTSFHSSTSLSNIFGLILVIDGHRFMINFLKLSDSLGYIGNDIDEHWHLIIETILMESVVMVIMG